MNQQEYIAILFQDCGYETTAQRKAWLKLRFDWEFADELSPSQKNLAIELLKDEKGVNSGKESRKDS